jgi:hypothetical protein
MAKAQLALTGIETTRLEGLLRHLHRGELECPMSPVGLTCVGFQDVSEIVMGVMRGLDERGARAVLVAVLAERQPR